MCYEVEVVVECVGFVGVLFDFKLCIELMDIIKGGE